MVNFPDISTWHNLHGDILEDYEACLAAIIPPSPVICQSGYHAESGLCVPNSPALPDTPPNCGSGYHMDSGICVSDIVNPPTCNPGYHLNNGVCVPDSIPARCEDVIANSHLDELLNDCVCNTGYHAENGQCVPIELEINCPPGYRLNQAGDACELIPTTEEPETNQPSTMGLSIKPIFILIGVAIIGIIIFKN